MTDLPLDHPHLQQHHSAGMENEKNGRRHRHAFVIDDEHRAWADPRLMVVGRGQNEVGFACWRVLPGAGRCPINLKSRTGIMPA